MGRHFDDDQQRNRGYSQRVERPAPGYGRGEGGDSRSEPSTEVLKGAIDWFNAQKGYGFVKLATTPDAYLSADVISAAGYSTLAPGTTVTVKIRGTDRRSVVRIESVDTSTAVDVVRKPGRSVEDTVEASLKWYDAGKGYGFLAADGFDVFLHVKVIERSGIQGDLAEGDHFRVGIANGERGKVAVTLERT